MQTETNHQSRFGGQEEDMPGVAENRSHDEELIRMDVTLIDAFKIKEINLLIASYVFAMCHNLYILKSDKYTGVALDQNWYNFGSIVGIIASGALVDLVFKKQRFLTILMLNGFILVLDIILYAQSGVSGSLSPTLTFCLGAVMSSIQIVYLILLPMLIAK